MHFSVTYHQVNACFASKSFALASLLGCLDVTLKSFGSRGCSVTSAEEEKARWTEEEALQDPQRPFGGSAGGLLRGCASEEGTTLALAGRRARTSELLAQRELALYASTTQTVEWF